MTLVSWLQLLKKTEIHLPYFLKIFCCLNRKKNTPILQISEGTLNCQEQLIKVLLNYNVLT